MGANPAERVFSPYLIALLPGVFFSISQVTIQSLRLMAYRVSGFFVWLARAIPAIMELRLTPASTRYVIPDDTFFC